MAGFRAMLIVLWLVLLTYTFGVIAAHGWGLIDIFFGDIAARTWPGQFNLDFLCFLVLSATWTAWRERFAARGLMLAPIALFGGAGFLLPYLLWLTVRDRGDMRRVLLGRHA